MFERPIECPSKEVPFKNKRIEKQGAAPVSFNRHAPCKRIATPDQARIENPSSEQEYAMQELKKVVIGAVAAAAVLTALPRIASADTGASGKTGVCKDSGIRKADRCYLLTCAARSGTRDTFIDGGHSWSYDVYSDGL
jgi:hypothetical protein